jgi:two-component system, NtrC family, response regulator HydG
MKAYLTMIKGARVGEHFALDPTRDNRIGRGTDCSIVIDDPLCSRVHAVVFFEGEGWWVRDAGSRNGTFVHDQKIDEARVSDHDVLRVGDCEYSFSEAVVSPGDTAETVPPMTQTIVHDAVLDSSTDVALGMLKSPGQVDRLLVLHQLAIRLLRSTDSTEVVQVGLELLHAQTSATVVGYLSLTDGVLRPKTVIPHDRQQELELSKHLTELVSKERRAIWIDQQTASSKSESLSHFADAICVPLLRNAATFGALHLYVESTSFEQSDFETAVGVGQILSSALVRAQQDEVLRASHDRVVQQNASFDELIGESPPMLTLKSRIQRVAAASGAVLIRGESGTGKELVASAVHRASPRADQPMLAVNCAAMPRELMESQLFGHKRGAFTGADADHVGWFQRADGGTLFLDEVGEMTLEGQAKLLRILEGHPFHAVGGSEEVQVDVRVVAATNRDLREFVQKKRFREDLFYRLSVFELSIPPLRERGEDIECLLNSFLDHFRLQHGRSKLELAPTARKALLSYPWPGNVRQLRNVIDSAVVMADDQIETDVLGLREVANDTFASLKLTDWEKKLIVQALERTGNNVQEAAKLLGIGRATLYRKLEEYELK